jgi:hypothetical protein
MALVSAASSRVSAVHRAHRSSLSSGAISNHRTSAGRVGQARDFLDEVWTRGLRRTAAAPGPARRTETGPAQVRALLERFTDGVFAAQEAQGHSVTYTELAEGVAADPDLLALVDLLPQPKRQPNLLLASVRYLGGPVTGYTAFRTWTIDHWPQVHATILRRRTQTNEPGRCACLLPVLAGLPQPLALIEVGASAGLCLYPDRYRYVCNGRIRIGCDTSPSP